MRKSNVKTSIRRNVPEVKRVKGNANTMLVVLDKKEIIESKNYFPEPLTYNAILPKRANYLQKESLNQQRMYNDRKAENGKLLIEGETSGEKSEYIVLKGSGIAKKSFGKLYVVEGIKKDIRSINKEFQQLKMALESLAMQAHGDGNKVSNGVTPGEVVGYTDISAICSKLYIKVYMSGAKLPVRVSMDAAMRYLKHRKKNKAKSHEKNGEKRRRALPKVKKTKVKQKVEVNPLTKAEKENLVRYVSNSAPYRMGDSLVIDAVPEGSSQVTETALTTVSEYTDVDVVKENRIKEVAVIDFDENNPPLLETKMASPVAYRNLSEYDIESIAEKNGIKVRELPEFSGTDIIENLERKHKVYSKENKGKNEPKKRQDSYEKKETEKVAGKNRVRSKEHKDNLKKKEKESRKKNRKQKKSGGSSRTADAMKREMKYLIARQLYQEGEDSGIGEAVVGVGRAALADTLKGIGKGILKVVRKTLGKIVMIIGTLLWNLFVALIMALFPVLFPVFVILFCVVAIVVLASAIVGLFIGTDNVSQDDFAVKLIENYKSSIIKEAEDYKGTEYKGALVEEMELHFENITDIDANSDDMLLIYMTEATDEGKFSEDSGQAPLLNVNTRTEKKVMEKVLREMLYIESVTYEEKIREIVVMISPSVSPTVVPMPELSVTPEAQETIIPVVTPELSETVTLTPQPTVSVSAITTPTPTPEPEYMIVQETYYIVHITIYGISADVWEKENISGKEETVFAFLYEMFRAFGYQPGGGETVCIKYLNAQLE